jgi:PHD/YefM family antitoxin component YafN of YafNO toxin-antitoxin module
MTKARQRLTEIIDIARDKDAFTALLEYGRPRAFVVSVAHFEHEMRLEAIVRTLQERDPALYDEILQGLRPARVPAKMPEIWPTDD